MVRDGADRIRFLDSWCALPRDGWETHAYCLASNHFTLWRETLRSSLSAGMR